MAPHDRRAIKASAQQSLAAAPFDPKKLILFHTGITIAVSLLATVINFIMAQQIQNTGGLSGMAARSLLSTVQSVTQLAVAFAVPFWEIGYCFATLKIAKNEPADPSSLLEGFRRFAPLLRAMLLQGLIYLGIGIVAFSLSSRIFLMTPLSDPFYNIMENAIGDPTLLPADFVLDEATATAALQSYTPMLLIFLAVFLLAVLVVSYRFRMINYLLLDHPGMRARDALRYSGYQLSGFKFSLFKLDLSFLWYYGLQILISILAYGDYLLPALGGAFPFSSEVAYFLFLGLSLALQAGLLYLFRNRVDVTYAKFYLSTELPLFQDENRDR